MYFYPLFYFCSEALFQSLNIIAPYDAKEEFSFVASKVAQEALPHADQNFQGTHLLDSF